LCGYKGDKFFLEDFSGCRSEIGARVLFLKKGKSEGRKEFFRVLCSALYELEFV
jgi:hypothetical protein